MPNLNRVSFAGHLGRDAEVKATTNGKTVASFSMAATEKWEGGEHTEWLTVVAWGKLSDLCRDLHKGDAVFVEGKLKTRSYTGRDGVQKKVTECVAQLIFVEAGRNQTTAPADDFQGSVSDDENIPF
jgi:single-strand DNA-binding protein